MNLTAEILKSNFSIRVKTQGYSMLPFIRASDYVIIKPIRREETRIGDILAYTNNSRDKIICHRLVKRMGLALITKGDSYLRTHEIIFPDSLLGKVVSVERGRNMYNFETNFQKLLAPYIAWMSLRFPVFIFIVAYFIETLTDPYFVVIKIIQKIERYKIVHLDKNSPYSKNRKIKP